MINTVCESFRLNNIDAVIFDKDGTLTDSSIYWSEIIKRRAKKIQNDFLLTKENYFELVRVMGLNISTNKLLPEGPIAIKSRKEVINKINSHLVKKNINVTHEYLEKIFKEIHENFSTEAFKFIVPVLPAYKLVKVLKNFNVKLILLTSDTKKNADEAIRVLKLENYFDLVVGGDSGFGDKRLGNSCKQICKKLNLKTQKVISIGDAPVDNEMAINGDLKASILVESGQICFETLSQFSKYCVKDLSEIKIESNI